MKLTSLIFRNGKRIVGTALLLSMMTAQTVSAAGTVESSIKSKGNVEYDTDNDGTAEILFYSKDLKDLGGAVDTLNSNNAVLSSNYNILSNSNATLQSKYNSLNTSLTNLSNSYDKLISDVNTNRQNLITAANSTIRKNSNLASTATYADLKTAIANVKTKGAQTYTPTTSNQTIPTDTFLLGAQTIKGDANLVAANIAKGKSIFGVAGSFTADGTAVASEILSGKTAYVNGSKITGTIPSKGAQTYTPTTYNQTISAAQYLSGVQTIAGDANLVSANIAKGKSIFGVAGSYTSDANAVASDILSGKTAYVNGSKITGTIPSKAAQTYTPTTYDQTINASQYLSGVQTIKGDSSLVAANIAKGKSIFGVAGSYTADANAGASDIWNGKTAYVNGQKVTGTLTLAQLTNDANAVASDLWSGKTAYVNGSKITGTLTLAGLTWDATASEGTILSGKTAYVNGQKITGTLGSPTTVTGYRNTGTGSHSLGTGTRSFDRNLYLGIGELVTFEPGYYSQSFSVLNDVLVRSGFTVTDASDTSGFYSASSNGSPGFASTGYNIRVSNGKKVTLNPGYYDSSVSVAAGPDRYNEGYSDGDSAGYTRGYNEGDSAGVQKGLTAGIQYNAYFGNTIFNVAGTYCELGLSGLHPGGRYFISVVIVQQGGSGAMYNVDYMPANGSIQIVSGGSMHGDNGWYTAPAFDDPAAQRPASVFTTCQAFDVTSSSVSLRMNFGQSIGNSLAIFEVWGTHYPDD